MTAKRVYRVEPVYGWGWSCARSVGSRVVPEPFEFTSEDASQRKGLIVTPSHEFVGAVVILGPRYSEPTTTFNVAIERDGHTIAFGYAVYQHGI